MPSRSFKRFAEQELGKFPAFSIYAILEWIMITILFLDGFLAFIANEFAKLFELRPPCVHCTRIDHVLVRKNHDSYYNESICESHKKNISYLAYCHAHKKLSDIRKMCEGCLLSFATEKESDIGTYKSLVGILHKDLECFVEDDDQIHLKLPTINKDDDDDGLITEQSDVHHCSCCGVPLKVKSSYPKESAKNRSLFSQTPVSSPRTPFLSSRNGGTRSLELPHNRYAELNFISGEDCSNPVISGYQGNEDDLIDDPLKTPNTARANRFFGISLDSASASPRWLSRTLKKSPLEKTEFASESTDANTSNVEAVDGQSILYRLKRQVRLDRKSLMALYMELDEERSASTIAANNAMAMITRLQADKAAVQMDALQYQRMMEEQAEYDQEALQVMKELLTKKDDELEAYREKFGGTVVGEDFINGESEIRDDDEFHVMKSESQSPLSEKSENSTLFSFDENNFNRTNLSQAETFHDESSLDFCGERSHFLKDSENPFSS